MGPCRALDCEYEAAYNIQHRMKLVPGQNRNSDDGWWRGLFCHRHTIRVLEIKLQMLNGVEEVVIKKANDDDLVDGKIDLRDSVQRLRPWYTDPRLGSA